MRLIRKGATSQSIYFTVFDSSSTTAGRLTGLVYNASGLTAYYTRSGAAATSITLATLASASASWSSGGLILVSDTNAPGLIRLDVPDAAFASGADSVVITLKGATNMAQVDVEVQLTGMDVMDSVRAGLTAIPAAAPAANGGLPTVDANNRIVGIQGTITTLDALDTAQDSQHSTTQGKVDTAQADLDILTGADGAVIASGTQTFNMTGNITGNLSGSVGSLTGHTAQTGDTYALANGANGFAALKSDTAATLADTNELQTDWVNGGRLDLLIDSVIDYLSSTGVVVATNNDKTGMRLSATGVDDILDEVVVGSYTLRQLLRGFGAALLGKVSGADTTSPVFRSADDAKNVISATTDASGNRSAVTLDLT